MSCRRSALPVKCSVNGTNRDSDNGGDGRESRRDRGQHYRFKVGAATYGTGNETTTAFVQFNASNATTATPAGYSNQFTMIRSIRVSLIGRTQPDSIYRKQFSQFFFDGGQYRIQALSLVINPRNLSMND